MLTPEMLIAVLSFGATCFGLGLTFGLLFKATWKTCLTGSPGYRNAPQMPMQAWHFHRYFA